MSQRRPFRLLLATAAVLTFSAGAGCDDEPVGTGTQDIDATTTLPDSSSVPDSTSNPDAEVDTTPSDPPIAPLPPGGKCDYVATDQGAGGEFGTGCTSNADCKWSECLQPWEGGNLTNNTFGFCTRGCDCGTTETTIPADQKSSLQCLYPPGNQRKWAHVAVRCGSVADCQALDPRWTACKLPSAGGVQAVCHALVE